MLGLIVGCGLVAGWVLDSTAKIVDKVVTCRDSAIYSVVD